MTQPFSIMRILFVPILILGLFHFGFSQQFYKGVDLSYVNELEDCGTSYFDESGNQTDAYDLFNAKGANLVRLRLWHNPTWTNYSNLADIKKSIVRAKEKGLEVLLDFHYSDFWTDPGRNWRPAAWEGIDDDKILGDSLYQYTMRTLQSLYRDNLLPEILQIGNETNGNILIKMGSANIDGSSPGLYPINWQRQSMLFNRALDAVDDFEASTQTDLKTVLHVAEPNSIDSWFSSASQNDLTNFDIIGISYYPQYHDFDVREVGEKVAEIKSKFQKEVMIVEIGYPWTTQSSGDAANNILGAGSKLATYDSFSPTVQAEFLTELSWLVKENGGMGVIYWEPAWVSSSCKTYWGTGSHYENATFFDFDNMMHEGANFLSYDYEQKPTGLLDQEVIFQVNMKGVEDIQGVYVTGDFTGQPWQFVTMSDQGNDLFQVTANIQGRSSGAYVFYKKDDWAIEWRETVPSNCASYWETHRSLIVKDEPLELDFAWNSCDQQVIKPDKPLFFLTVDQLEVYPNPTRGKLIINSNEKLNAPKLYDALGNEYMIKITNGDTYDISHLGVGLYLLQIQGAAEMHTIKIIKE
ncbi:MAG: arabinogalactan endo-1,4-beta-galactosidase [Marinoscillum sp.]|jgi:arabinogalactan endo-1,4-beta-galactosidase